MTHRLFHFIRFKDIKNWSVLQHQEHDFGYSDSYPLVAIGKFLRRNKTAVEIQDSILYKRLSIHSKNGGIDIRDELYGDKIGTKNQFVVKAGQFALSKIDARNGAFGVVPQIADGAIITGNFWTFDVDYSQVNPAFLALLTTTKSFLRFAEMASNGTTNRHYLQEDKFLQQRIPLPSLAEQNRLVEVYHHLINKSYDKDSASIEVEQSIESFILTKLGMCNQVVQHSYTINGYKCLRFIKLCEITTRWDCEYFTNNQEVQSIYPLRTLKSLLLPIVGNQTKIKEKDILSKGKYPVVTQEKGALVSGYTNNPAVIEDLPLVVFGDHSCSFKYVDFPFVRGADGTKLLKFNKDCNAYFYMELLSTINIDNSEKYQRHYKYIENKLIPVPPLSVQQEIVDHVTAERAKAKALKEEAIRLREQAKTEFENQIFAIK